MICIPHGILYLFESLLIVLSTDLNFGWLNFPVIFIEADKSYGPIKIASNPFTNNNFSKFLTE